MQRATATISKGEMTLRAGVADAVKLDLDQRRRRRLVLHTAGGQSVLLDLPAAPHLRDGDGLLLDNGGVVRVEAAHEPLIEITADDQVSLVRIALHLGNRHLPVQISANALLIRQDHVLEEMVRHLGGITRDVSAPFDPEGGAYEGMSLGDHSHAHGHHHHHHHHHHDHDHG